MNTSLQVNAANLKSYLFVGISVTLVTFLVNLWAGLSILKKEKNRVHNLIALDCLVNVISSLHNSLLAQSPWSQLISPTTCLINTSFIYMLVFWNRLVPVAIAAFRYILVCHSVFVHNHGGEKKVGQLLLLSVVPLPVTSLSSPTKVWRLLIFSLSAVSLSGCGLFMYNPESSRTYLLCIGRQELFR